MRADVKAIMGIHLASIVVNNDSYQALLIKKKEFREGQSSKEVLSRDVFGVPVDLRMLPAILFDESINAVGWICSSDGRGFLQKCENQENKISLEVTERDGQEKTVVISGEGYIMKLIFGKFSPDESFSEKTFNLPVPKGFKRL